MEHITIAVCNNTEVPNILCCVLLPTYYICYNTTKNMNYV